MRQMKLQLLHWSLNQINIDCLLRWKLKLVMRFSWKGQRNTFQQIVSFSLHFYHLGGVLNSRWLMRWDFLPNDHFIIYFFETLSVSSKVFILMLLLLQRVCCMRKSLYHSFSFGLILINKFYLIFLYFLHRPSNPCYTV